MGRKFISDEVKKALTGIYGLLFIGNAKCDNMVGQLDVKFVMPNLSHLVHYHLAHEFPIMADAIGDYAAERNEYLPRPNVPAEATDYQNIKVMFEDLLEYMADLEDAVKEVITMCTNVGDYATKVVMDGFLRDLIPYTAIVININDYIEKNGYEPYRLMDMDARINSFINVDE